jgi:hypothetical protein
MPDQRKQAITGLTPPDSTDASEALIRQNWPTVAAYPGIASLGRKLSGTYVLAPLGWLLMAQVFFGKFIPFLAKRYAVTNKRVLIRTGITGKPGPAVPLGEIDEVRVVTDANSDFFRSGTLEIISNGQVRLSLPGVPEPEGFKHAIINACNAWVPNRKRGAFIPASATK